MSRSFPRNAFSAALILFGLILWPILHADRLYIDDMGRASAGYLGWGSDGRPLANVLMEVVNAGTPLTDITPVPQLAALLMLAGLAALIGRRFQLPGSWLPALCVLPLAGSPYYLENLSYKFDVLTMTAALVLAAIAALDPMRGRLQLPRKMLLLLMALCLYQPAANVYVLLVIAQIVAGQWRDTAPGILLRQLGSQIGATLLACLLYAVVLKQTVRGGYSNAHSSIDPTAVAANLAHFWHYVLMTMTTLRGWVLLVLAGVAVPLALIGALRYAIRTWPHAGVGTRIALGLAVPLLPLALLVAPWGPMLVLADPVFAPRVMMGFGALMAASALILATAVPRLRVDHRYAIGLLVVPAAVMVLIASVYGNSLEQQKAYEDNLSGNMVDDVAALRLQNQLDGIALVGEAGHPPIVRHNMRKHPILAELLPVHLTQGWGWATEQLRMFGPVPPMRTIPAETIEQLANQKPDIARAAYRVYVRDHVAIFMFKRNGEPPPIR
ncbi:MULTISPECIES: glucosyltransferase domain-containing protein [unclassified Achromobacter]|uniref:glucosyltransferase domain-containing protein n=1 Tax=unclassified Achromobacter TaxID=2626865 RepID=UPI001302EBB1|nr:MULTISPECIES: glucosyltransferase domain-containing protein [unclassified Achromobacter]